MTSPQNISGNPFTSTKTTPTPIIISEALSGQREKLTKLSRCFQRAIELNPDFADAYFNLGNTLCCDKDGLMRRSTQYREAIARNPYFFAAYYNLGKAFQDRGNSDEAIICLSRRRWSLTRILPISTMPLEYFFREKDDSKKQSRYYQKAIELNPYFAGALRQSGKSLSGERVSR